MSPKVQWSVKRIQQWQGNSSEGRGRGDAVLLFLGRHTTAVVEAEAKREVGTNSEEVKLTDDKG